MLDNIDNFVQNQNPLYTLDAILPLLPHTQYHPHNYMAIKIKDQQRVQEVRMWHNLFSLISVCEHLNLWV